MDRPKEMGLKKKKSSLILQSLKKNRYMFTVCLTSNNICTDVLFVQCNDYSKPWFLYAEYEKGEF